MLELMDVQARYETLTALRGVTLKVSAGQVTALFGHNGAGKTTLLRCAVGDHRKVEGSVTFDGVPIKVGEVHRNVRLGIALVPQGHGIFSDVTVSENLDIAGMGRDPAVREQVYELFPILGRRSTQLAGSLSGGQQQMLAVGMALMTQPRMLLLDEPSTGLAPVLVEQLMDGLAKIHESTGMGIVLVEQNVKAALRIVERVVVLKGGAVVLDESAEDFARTDMWQWF